jgi:hypothetical protein
VETEEMKLRKIVSDAVLIFKSDKIRKIQKEIAQQISEAEKANDKDKVNALIKRHLKLSSALVQISRQVGDGKRILL